MKSQTKMMMMITFNLILAIDGAYANAGEKAQTSDYVLSQLLTLQNCKQPAPCKEKRVSIPEKIVVSLMNDGKEHFKVSSTCREIKGRLVMPSAQAEGGVVKVIVERKSDHCGNKELSLYHDPAFDRFVHSTKWSLSGNDIKLTNADGHSLLLSAVSTSVPITTAAINAGSGRSPASE